MFRFEVMVQSLAGLSVLALLVGVALSLLLLFPAGRVAAREQGAGSVRLMLAFAWVASAVAMAGSLYLSDVVGFVPCLLCWYQRIAMYPLVPVLGVAALTADGKVWRYGLPLSLTGLLISVYHVALQYQPSLEVLTCSADAPCSARYLHVFGFVSIPVMAGSGFLLISAVLAAAALAGRGAEPGGAELRGAEPGDGELRGTEPGGA